jgi:hypothetical protein
MKLAVIVRVLEKCEIPGPDGKLGMGGYVLLEGVCVPESEIDTARLGIIREGDSITIPDITLDAPKMEHLPEDVPLIPVRLIKGSSM